MTISPHPTHVSIDSSQARIVVEDIPDRPGTAAAIFSALADASIAVDLILENYARDNRTTLTFTLPEAQRHKAYELVRHSLETLGGAVLMHGPIAKLTVAHGSGSSPAVAARLFKVLAGAGINIDMISTTEAEVAVVISPDDANRAVPLVQEAFEPGHHNLVGN
jgi:aspartate kinase